MREGGKTKEAVRSARYQTGWIQLVTSRTGDVLAENRNFSGEVAPVIDETNDETSQECFLNVSNRTNGRVRQMQAGACVSDADRTEQTTLNNTNPT